MTGKVSRRARNPLGEIDPDFDRHSTARPLPAGESHDTLHPRFLTGEVGPAGKLLESRMNFPSVQQHQIDPPNIVGSIAGFLGSVAIGYLVFVVTNNPIAGAGLPAIRAGWESVRTGWWILRTDRDIARGRICFAFCIATAFWQGATAAFVSVVMFIAIEKIGGGPPGIPQFAATMITLACGVGVTALTGLVATLAAAIAGVRVWVNPGMRKLAKGDLNQVSAIPSHQYFNFAIFVLATSLALPVVLLCMVLLIAPPSPWSSLAVLILGPILVIAGYLWFSGRIIAEHPGACWPDGTG